MTLVYLLDQLLHCIYVYELLRLLCDQWQAMLTRIRIQVFSLCLSSGFAITMPWQHDCTLSIPRGTMRDCSTPLDGASSPSYRYHLDLP